MLISKAKCRYIRISPYKLRPIIDVIRGQRVDKALAWLGTCSMKRTKSVTKTLMSAYANANDLHSGKATMENLFIKEIKVDQGPVVKYYKPAAMGRAAVQRKRMSHLEISLSEKDKSSSSK